MQGIAAQPAPSQHCFESDVPRARCRPRAQHLHSRALVSFVERRTWIWWGCRNSVSHWWSLDRGNQGESHLSRPRTLRPINFPAEGDTLNIFLIGELGTPVCCYSFFFGTQRMSHSSSADAPSVDEPTTGVDSYGDCLFQLLYQLHFKKKRRNLLSEHPSYISIYNLKWGRTTYHTQTIPSENAR